METLFVQLPNDVISVIMNNITTQSENDYWQNMYKQKFSQNVLPYIDKELRLVGFTKNGPCSECYIQKQICLNCEEINTPDIFEFISWNDIKKNIKYGIFYNTFKHYFEEQNHDIYIQLYFMDNILPCIKYIFRHI
jgi:hypothetical protein